MARYSAGMSEEILGKALKEIKVGSISTLGLS